MSEEVKDITVIGAGPSGLFTAFQAGMHEASVRIIDSMSEPGGQLTALYPEKYIFDAPGFSKVTARDFADNLFEQANQFAPELRFGESALDWVINLLDTARDIALVHRRDAFRAHPNTIQQVSAKAAEGRIRVFTSCEVKGVSGSGKLEEVVVVDAAGKEVVLRADALLLMLGFTSDLGPVEKWGLDIEDSRIKVNVGMETNRKGVFAIGDIATYPGKLKLILTGFSEGALAVRSAVPYIRPGDKFKHAYSTSLKIFSKIK